MTDKEKIEAEIIKSIDEIYNGRKFDDLAYHEQYALWWLKSINNIINSFPKEPISEDLEEAAKEFSSDPSPLLESLKYDCFKTGAKWKEKQITK